MVTTALKSFDTFAFVDTTSSCITLSVTGIGLIVVPITAATAYGLSISNKIKYEITMKN